MFIFIQQKMNDNLIVWKNEFLKKYRFNKFDFLNKTKKMKFNFDNEKIFTLNQYFFRKINHLRDVDIQNEILLISYLWKKLNVQLILIIFFRENYDIVKNFDRRIKQNEIVVKKIHQKIARIIRFAINRSIDNKFRVQIIYQSQNYQFVFNYSSI